MRYLPPVKGVKVYVRDVIVVREAGLTGSQPGPRGIITELSFESRQRLAFVACNTSVVFHTMLTLTYPCAFPNDGLKVKRNLHAFLQWLRRDIGWSYEYLWFLEFQDRGAPHIHLLIDYAMPPPWVSVELAIHGQKQTVTRRNPDAVLWIKAWRFRIASAWYRIVGSRDPKHLVAGTRVEAVRKPDGAKRYAVKYAMKTHQKRVPVAYQNVGRFWGHSKAVRPKPIAVARCTEDDVRGRLEGWRYAPPASRTLYKYLYGQADAFL